MSTNDETGFSPLQVSASQTVTVNVYDLEKDARIVVTLDGDVTRLVSLLPQMIRDALDGMAAQLNEG